MLLLYEALQQQMKVYKNARLNPALLLFHLFIFTYIYTA